MIRAFLQRSPCFNRKPQIPVQSNEYLLGLARPSADLAHADDHLLRHPAYDYDRRQKRWDGCEGRRRASSESSFC